MRRLAGCAVTLLFGFATALTGTTTPVDLLIHPAELTFDNPRDGRKLLVTGILESGERVDLTADAEVSTTNAPVERGDDGYFTPTTSGNGSLTIHAGGLTATVPVTVQAAPAANAALPGHLRPRRPARDEQGRLLHGHLPRRRQGQERLQAVAARLRPGVRLPVAALRHVRPALQPRRARALADARQADDAGRPRGRPEARPRLALLQPDPRLDRRRRALRRPGDRPRRAADDPSRRGLHAPARNEPADDRHRPLRRRPAAAT